MIMIKNRSNEILELLSEHKKIEVTALSELLGVSQVTIRKDLDALEQTGVLRREHGFAILASTNNVQGRLAYHHESKLRIAAVAAELVSDGETVMIENGSCCALLAETLTKTRKGLTILTNSAFIADFIRQKSDFEIVLFGGIYQPDSQVMVGPMVRQCSENFFVRHFFIGVDGYSERTGFTNCNQLRAQAVRDMSHQADEVIVLTESDKFSIRGTIPLNITSRISRVVTDNNIPPKSEETLVKQGILVTKVD